MRNIWLGKLLSLATWMLGKVFRLRVYMSVAIECVVRKVKDDDDKYGDKLYKGLW